MTKDDQAVKLAELLNAGTDPYDALDAVGLDEDDVHGEDMGDYSLPLDDPDNEVIDMCWNDDETEHHMVRFSWNSDEGKKMWQVEKTSRVS